MDAIETTTEDCKKRRGSNFDGVTCAVALNSWLKSDSHSTFDTNFDHFTLEDKETLKRLSAHPGSRNSP